jgi:hypothetical protein
MLELDIVLKRFVDLLSKRFTWERSCLHTGDPDAVLNRLDDFVLVCVDVLVKIHENNSSLK